MQIIEKLGGYKKVLSILNGFGCKVGYFALANQKYRKNLSKDVSLILMDYCNKNNIPVSLEDFKG